MLGRLVRDGRIGYRRLYGLRLLRRFRRRVDRMRREITRAMLADPNPFSLEEILAQLAVSQPWSGLTRTHFVIARSEATWRSRFRIGVPGPSEIAALRS